MTTSTPPARRADSETTTALTGRRTAMPIDIAVEQVMTAPRGTVFSLLVDVTRMGEWSPETISASWLDGATAAAVGVRFRGRNKIGAIRWSTKPVITRFEPNHLFEFEVPGRATTTWRYELSDVADGTLVRERRLGELASG